ncbi:MAG: hypothetical protein KOO66_03835 [Bacteroidales bacterium]|nr:hypothetical protein [Bacteroidales bacterium]
MKKIYYIIIAVFFTISTFAQTNDLQSEVDSLVDVLVKERRQWNEASEKLIVIGEPAADKLLEALMNKSLDSWARRKAAMTLSGINADQIITPCLNVFTDESEYVSVRINACKALSSVNLNKYEDLFLLYAKNDNSDIRNVCYQRLGQIGSEKAIKFLTSEVDKQQDMGKWIILHILEPFDTQEVNEKFINALCDDNWWMINEYARNTLIKRGNDVLEPIQEILENTENNEFIRWKAIWVIKDLESPQRIKILQKALEDESWFIRNEAEVALKKEK